MLEYNWGKRGRNWIKNKFPILRILFSDHVVATTSKIKFLLLVFVVATVTFPSMVFADIDTIIATKNYVDSMAEQVRDVKEDVSNKVLSVSGGGTGLTSESSDDQYPSAKAVYDGLAVKEDSANKVKSVAGGGAGLTAASTDEQYVSAKVVYDELATKEANVNKVKSVAGGGTGLTAASTDEQYTSAKVAYDGLATKVDIVPSAVNGNFVAFGANGQVADSAKNPASFVEVTGDQSVAGQKTFQTIPIIPTATLPSI